MLFRDGFVPTIGNTPLIKLKALSALTGCVAGAVRMARELGPGHVIVTLLCDSGTRYASRLFNPEFLRGKGLPVPPWLAGERPRLPEGILLP